jgi:hypothetical protein
MAVATICKAEVRPRRALGRTPQKRASYLGSYYSHFVLDYSLLCPQAFKHIFTSPSSVEKEVKATRSGNARIHGMTRVTTASLAYIATQVRLMSRHGSFKLSVPIASFCIVINVCLLQV